MISVQEAVDGDYPAIWRIMEPVARSGETYAMSRDITENEAIGHIRFAEPLHRRCRSPLRQGILEFVGRHEAHGAGAILAHVHEKVESVAR